VLGDLLFRRMLLLQTVSVTSFIDKESICSEMNHRYLKSELTCSSCSCPRNFYGCLLTQTVLHWDSKPTLATNFSLITERGFSFLATVYWSKSYTHQVRSVQTLASVCTLLCSASCFFYNEVSILGQPTRCNNYFHRQSSMSSFPLASIVLNTV
jgi:hypothetical protein